MGELSMPSRCQFRLYWLLCVAVLTLVVAGCPEFWGFWQQQSQGDAELIPFNSADDLLSYFKQQATLRHQSRAGGLFWGGLAASDGEAAPAAAEDTGSNDQASDGQSFSTTNIQETGVDESDVIKSDGTYFYVAKDRSLRIVRATPEDRMAEVGQLEVETAIDSMYLFGSKLILLGQAYQDGSWGDAETRAWPPYYQGSSLTVYEVDVSDPASPAVTGQVELDGSLVTSRLTNERVLIVLAIVPDLPEDPTPVSIGLVTLEQVMPKVRTVGGEQDMVPWEDWLYPTSPDGYYMTAVVTLDANDIESILASVAVLANAGTIYASTEALYITDAEYDPSDNYRETTAIHKFAFDAEGVARYAASGSVPGRLLNQFSLGEHEDYLRAATHVTNYQSYGLSGGVGVAVAEAPGDDDAADDAQSSAAPTEFNAVYVLAEADGKLELTGAIENVAPGEQLHSARFLGERGFLVTFRRIDPLFTLDLSDPTDPEIKGELKIPGYSDYLHPLGDSHLIGVGRSVVTMSSWGGEEPGAAQLSLFDVSDLDNPTVVQQIELGGMHSWSYVTQTHKAFTLMPDEGLLAIPMRLTDEDTAIVEYDLEAFYGVVCFEVDPETGFTELGRLAAVGTPDTDYEMWYPGADFWMRAAFIGNTVYAVSADGVRAAALADFQDVTTVELEE
jgi:inhibitor of cysteine peptidase